MISFSTKHHPAGTIIYKINSNLLSKIQCILQPCFSFRSSPRLYGPLPPPSYQKQLLLFCVDNITLVHEISYRIQIVAIILLIMAVLVIPTLNYQRHGAFRVRHQVVLGFTFITAGTIVVEVKAEEEDRAAGPVVGPVPVVQAQVAPVVVPMEATMMMVVVAVGVET